MLIEKIKELTQELYKIQGELKSLELELADPDGDAPPEEEVDIDRVAESLATFKLNVTYLKLKTSELKKAKDVDFSEMFRDIKYFVRYMKHTSKDFDEICNSLVYGARTGDEVAIQKASEEIFILQKHLIDMNHYLESINAKLGKK